MSRGLSRLWRRLRAGFRSPAAQFVYSPRYGLDLPSAGFDSRRADRVVSFLAGEGLLRRGQIHRARRSAMSSLRRVHEDTYLDGLQLPGALAPIVGFDPDDERQDEFLDSQRAMVGGTNLACAMALQRGGIVVNLAGGLHHARADFGQGFCAFNDVAVAIASRRAAGFDKPVLVVDLDLHDGEGTRAIFADDATVHTFSVHNRHLGSTEAVASTSIELGSGVVDATYLGLLRERLPAVNAAVRPGLVVYLAGNDPAHDDRLGDWRISAEGLLERDRLVLSTFQEPPEPPPLVILLAGGYGGNAWRYSARFFGWLLSGGALIDPPRTSQQTLSDFRRIAHRLEVAQLTVEPGDSWKLAEDDLLPTQRRSRLLDFYSRHGIELALERYGFFDRLRDRGHPSVRVDLDLEGDAAQTVRILTGGDTPERLIELRLRRDLRTIPGFELLGVDWLLLQDPSARFSDERPRLPGQQHPGLGLLREVSSLLVLMCERLGLDGMVFVPTHYHIAAQTGDYFHFFDEAAEARFHALRRDLDGLHLLEAAIALDAGQVYDVNSGSPVTWEPAAMVLPVSARLKQRAADPERRRRVVAAAQGYGFELRRQAAQE